MFLCSCKPKADPKAPAFVWPTLHVQDPYGQDAHGLMAKQLVCVVCAASAGSLCEKCSCLQAGAQHVQDYRLAVQKWFRHRDKPQARSRGRNGRSTPLLLVSEQPLEIPCPPRPHCLQHRSNSRPRISSVDMPSGLPAIQNSLAGPPTHNSTRYGRRCVCHCAI